jgi:hypothetical protein
MTEASTTAGGEAGETTRSDCRSTTSRATGGGVDDTAVSVSHGTTAAREGLNEATCATRKPTRSSSSADSDLLFPAKMRRWSTLKATANCNSGVRASSEAGPSTRAAASGCGAKLATAEGGLAGGDGTGRPGGDLGGQPWPRGARRVNTSG